MRKRKPPYTLIAIAVVLMVVAGVLNAGNPLNQSPEDHAASHDHSGHDHPHPEGALNPEVAKEGVNEKNEKESAIASVKAAAESGPKRMPGFDPGPMVTSPDRSSIPAPNDSAVAGQWYTEEARKIGR